MAVQGAQETMAGGPCGRGLCPLGPAPTAGTLQERPSRARQTGQDIPQELEALLGWLGS